MKVIIVLLLTAAFLVIKLGREAVRAGRVERRHAGPQAPNRQTHPLVLLIGSLLSLMALYSLNRHLPADASGSWAVLFHFGFVCFWLVTMTSIISATDSSDE